jgi:hypothetical protein
MGGGSTRWLLACAFVLTASCAPKSSADVDGGQLDGGPASDDGGFGADGVAVLLSDERVELDHGVTFFNPTSPTLLESYLWSADTGCEAAMMGTPAQDFAQMFMIVRGARADDSSELRPIAATYPVVSHRSPVDPSTATLSFNLMPSGSLRGASGTVVIESIDADENVTLVVDAVLEDGTVVRGRMTLGRECR